MSTTAVVVRPANNFSVKEAENYFQRWGLMPSTQAIRAFVGTQMRKGCRYKKATLEFAKLEKVLVFRLACELDIPWPHETKQTIPELLTAERFILDDIWNDKSIDNDEFYSSGLNRGTSLQLIIPLGHDHRSLVEKLVDVSSVNDFKQLSIHECVESSAKGARTFSTPMRDLIATYPDLAVKVLNKFKRNTTQTSEVKADLLVKPRSPIEVSYDIVNDVAYFDSRGKKLTFRSPFDEIEFLKEDNKITCTEDKIYDRIQNHSLWLISVSDNISLLYHPIVQLFVLHMWDRVRWSFYYQLFYVFVYLIFLECFVLGESAFTMSSNHTEGVLSFPRSPVLSVLPRYVIGFLAITVSLCVIGLVRMFYRQARFTKTYITETLLELASYGFVFCYGLYILFSLPGESSNFWESFAMVLGTIGICLSWITFMLHCRVLPQIGWQIEVFLAIFTRYLRYMPVGILLVCGFGSSFVVLLRNVPMLNSVHTTLIIAAQMVFSQVTTKDVLDSAGGYREIHGNNLMYLLTVYFFIFGFFVLAILTFVNMLTGLANADVQKMLEHAEIKLYRRKLEISLEFANYYHGMNKKKDGRWLMDMGLKLLALSKKLPWGNSEKVLNDAIRKVVETFAKAK